MKKILLIGDSIRMGYDIYLKKSLEGTAEVYYPKENCRFAAYVLRNLHEWKNQLELSDDIDLVHWNAGLWDCLTLFEDGTLTPIDHYIEYIDRICRRIIILFPQAKVTFATSTPIVEHRFSTPKISIRYNSDVRGFNEAALKVIRKYDFEVDDLYSVVEANADESYYTDCAHLYTQKGTALLLKAVLKSVCASLDINTDVDCDKIVENYTGVDNVNGH